MQKHRVMIHRENLLTEVNGARQELGFYTNVYLEAFTASDAEARAIEMIREDASLVEVLLNPDDNPLKLPAEEVQEIETFDGHKLPRDAFLLVPSKWGVTGSCP